MSEYLFVYGTLLSVHKNLHARMLRRNSTLAGPGRIRGRLLKLGRYPGLITGIAGTRWVDGEVYHLSDPDRLLRTLDAYEGPEFSRKRRKVEVGDRIRHCWVYLYRASAKTLDTGSN